MIGVKIRNENDELTIDDNYKGYGIIQQGSITLSRQTITTLKFSVPITSIDQPILAVKRWPYTGFYVEICQLVGGPGNWTGFYLRGQRNTSLFPKGPGSVLFEYRVYAAGVASTDQYGLRVISSDGDIVIDSGRKQLGFMSSFTGQQVGSFPLGASAGSGNQRDLVYAVTNTLIAEDDWLPISLVTVTRFTSNRVIGPGLDVTGSMAVFISLICLNNAGNLTWNSPSMLGIYIYLEDIQGRRIQNYTIPLVNFTAIIKN